MPTKRELEVRIESLERRLAALERNPNPFVPIAPPPWYTPPLLPNVWADVAVPLYEASSAPSS